MKNFKWWQWVIALLSVAVAVFIGKSAFLFGGVVRKEWSGESKTLLSLVLAMSFVSLVMHLKNWYFEERQIRGEKVIGLALAQIERLESKLEEKNPPAAIPEVLPTGEHWPWGDHHTEQLGHLSAAAKRFWKLYDPSDIGTAPTNREISEWLVKERKVSRTMADAMASILRIDGLRTGPRE